MWIRDRGWSASIRLHCLMQGTETPSRRQNWATESCEGFSGEDAQRRLGVPAAGAAGAVGGAAGAAGLGGFADGGDLVGALGAVGVLADLLDGEHPPGEAHEPHHVAGDTAGERRQDVVGP
jgi:hypothetical protein